MISVRPIGAWRIFPSHWLCCEHGVFAGRFDPCRVDYRSVGLPACKREQFSFFSSFWFEHTRQSGDFAIQSLDPGCHPLVETGELRRFPPWREATRLSPPFLNNFLGLYRLFLGILPHLELNCVNDQFGCVGKPYAKLNTPFAFV